MAKKVEIKKKAPGSSGKAAAKSAVYTLPPLQGNGWLFLNDFRWQALAIIIVGFLYYGNSYKNNYCLDDDIIINKNMYVQKGMSGIPDILMNDAYKSFYESQGVEQQLSGGRYRPLSIITFAMEQSIFGQCYGDRATEARDSLFAYQRQGSKAGIMNKLVLENNYYDKKIKETNDKIAPIRHTFQIIWFVLSMVVLLWFLRDYVFRSNTDIAFLSVLLFTIHPIHTEVVANVKSRDEIFSLLFITLTFIYFFRYDLYRRTKDMWLGAVSFALAFLSKEYAVVLIVLLPVSIMLVHKRKLRDVYRPMIPFAVVFILYFILRLSVIGAATAPVDNSKQDVLNDPYLYATPDQKIASKINRLDDYLYLCAAPVSLSYDYSYQTFPYSRIFDWGVLLSLAVNITLVVVAFRLWQKRHPLAFPLLIYLFFFAMICNVFFDIGATMGERLIYHSSLGFCMAIAWLLVAGIEKISQIVTPKIALSLVFLLIAVPAWMITVKRNADWKNMFTLYTNDVKTHPNSAITNGNAGSQYMDLGLFWAGRDTIIGHDTIKQYGRDTVKVHHYADTALTYLLRATQLHKKYVNGYLNLGLCYYYKEQYELAAEAWGNAYQYFPSSTILLNYETLFVNQSNAYAAKKDFANAARFLKYATMTNPGDAKEWADYAGASFMSKDFPTAMMAFNQSYSLLDAQIKEYQKHLNQQGYDNDKINEQIKILQGQESGVSNGYHAADSNNKSLLGWKRDTMNVDSTIRLAKGYLGTSDFYPESKRLLNHALQIRPDDVQATRLLDSLEMLEQKMKLPPTPIKK